MPQSKVAAHIGVLDGVRCLAVGGVAAYHIWQQSWLQYVGKDFLAAHGLPYPDAVMDFIRMGDIQVDVLLLLSAFLLALPYARYRCGTAAALPGVGGFYRRRIARIVPSVYFALLVPLLFVVRPAQYGDTAAYIRDIVTHLTFTNVYFADTYYYTKLPGVLWTLCVEVAYYLVFPLLGRLFARRPLLCCGAMLAAYGGYYYIVALPAIQADGGNGLWAYNPLAFLPLYAIGMLAALCYAAIEKRRFAGRGLPLAATAVLFAAAWGLYRLICVEYPSDNTQAWRLRMRVVFALVCGAFIVALCFAAKIIQALFANPAARWLAGISLNFYIWHATIALWLKQLRIPPYPDAPQQGLAWPQCAAGESWHTAWQWQYTALCWGLALAAAVACTYLVEKPAARWINRAGKKNNAVTAAP